MLFFSAARLPLFVIVESLTVVDSAKRHQVSCKSVTVFAGNAVSWQMCSVVCVVYQSITYVERFHCFVLNLTDAQLQCSMYVLQHILYLYFLFK